MNAHASPYVLEAAERAKRFDAQRPKLDLRILPDGESGWRYVLRVVPPLDFVLPYIGEQGACFTTHAAARIAGETALKKRQRAGECEREAFLKFGRK